MTWRCTQMHTTAHQGNSMYVLPQKKWFLQIHINKEYDKAHARVICLRAPSCIHYAVHYMACIHYVTYTLTKASSSSSSFTHCEKTASHLLQCSKDAHTYARAASYTSLCKIIASCTSAFVAYVYTYMLSTTLPTLRSALLRVRCGCVRAKIAKNGKQCNWQLHHGEYRVVYAIASNAARREKSSVVLEEDVEM